MGGAQYGGFLLTLICFSVFFFRKGDIFGICESSVFSVSVSLSDPHCYVLFSSECFLKIRNDLK